jgi:hypothetical protein
MIPSGGTKKRFRLESSPHAMTTTTATANAPKDTSSMDALNEIMDDLFQSIQVLKTPTSITALDNDNPSNNVESLAMNIQRRFLHLKEWQRNMFHAIKESSNEYDQLRQEQHQYRQQLAAWKFERQYLEREIHQSHSFACPNLERLARQEQDDATVVMLDDVKDNNDENKIAVDIINTYVKVDVLDPSHRQHIMTQLQEEMTSRRRLEKEIASQKSKLDETKTKLQTQRKFLDQLPDQLSAVERASLPLQKFVTQHQANSSDKSTPRLLIGSDRRNRLEQAQLLPAPLYTLFSQLQLYLDRDSHALAGSSLAVHSDSESTSPRVILQVPVPEITSKQLGQWHPQKRLSLHFYHVSDPAVVTVAVTGGTAQFLQPTQWLLDELFPGDGTTETFPGIPGHPYHWCNTLAGIQGIRATSTILCTPSTRAVLRALHHRYMAHATLKYLSHQLVTRQVFPTLPGDAPAAGKLQNCSMVVEDRNESVARMSWSMEWHRQGQYWHVRATIQPVQYPAVPPVWTIQPSSSSSLVVYDERLAQLERRVNCDGLEDLVHQAAARGGTDSSSSDSSKYYPWILLLQLREIVQELCRCMDEQ